MPTVDVYSKPKCVQCDATYRAMDKAKIPYNSIDITEDHEAYQFAMSLGHMQAPVVVVRYKDRMEHWSGFSPTRIDALKDHYSGR